MNLEKKHSYFTIILIFLLLSPSSLSVDTLEAEYSNELFIGSSLRQPAEFETMESVLINYGAENTFSIPFSFIRNLSNIVRVIIIVDSSHEWDDAREDLISNDVNISNCEPFIARSDSYWTRDYGPWFVFDGPSDQLTVVDFFYNRPRPNDDNIPIEFAASEGFQLSTLPLEHTGGNYMTNGQGISVSTDLLFDENSETVETIHELCYTYLGIETYHVIPDVNNEYIQHIDCWAKFLSSDTLLIREVPYTHPQYEEIEKAVDYFERQVDSYDETFEIVRVYTPNDEPYTNSLIINDHVFVPITGGEWDDDALESYQNAMPGYIVEGVYAKPGFSWLSTDALHCRTKGVPDKEMLYIYHEPIKNRVYCNGSLTLEFYIHSFGNHDIIADKTTLYARLDNTSWQEYVLTMMTGQGWYETTLPCYGKDMFLEYYIHVEDTSGRVEQLPRMGFHDPYQCIITDEPILNPDGPLIDGPTSGRTNQIYTYSFVSNDPENDDVSYFINWGDGTESGWHELQPSGHEIILNHSWSEKGTYIIQAKARDEHGFESSWSSKEISMPRMKRNLFTPDFLDSYLFFSSFRWL